MKDEWVLPPECSLRLADQEDDAFLLSLFCSARPELALLPLPPVQLTQLLRQQYELQQRSYSNQYPQAEHWVVAKESVPVGKIMLARLPSSVHIVDFILAPQWRGRGIGRSILTALKVQAEAKSCTLSLQVDRQNINAKRLYQKLGFVISSFSDTHELLVWS